MIIKCPVCDKKIDDSSDICPYCGYKLNKENFDVIGNYAPSSATDTSGSFTMIADVFEDNISGKKKKDELFGEGIDETTLNSFINWGYLECKDDSSFCSLTDLGKKAYFTNREWKEKKKKKSPGEDTDESD